MVPGESGLAPTEWIQPLVSVWELDSGCLLYLLFATLWRGGILCMSRMLI